MKKALLFFFLLPVCAFSQQIGWFKIPSPSTENHEIRQLQFITEDWGYVYVGRQGLYLTSDGGNTWRLLLAMDSAADRQVVNFKFLSHRTGFIALEGSLLYTNDTANTWNVTDLPVNFPHWRSPFVEARADMNLKMNIIDSNTLIYGDNDSDNIYITTNGGEDWSAVPDPGAINDMGPQTEQCVFRNKDVGIKVYSKETNSVEHTRTRYLRRTSDGGKTWRDVLGYNLPHTEYIRNIFHVYSDKWIVFGDFGATGIFTEDGRNKYSLDSSNVLPYEINSPDGNTVIGGGILRRANSVFAKSNDGGFNWNRGHISGIPIDSVVGDTIDAAWFITSLHAPSVNTFYMGLESGDIYKTVDGGGPDLFATATERQDLLEFGVIIPNPAFETITIKHLAPTKGQLLELYDAFGRRMTQEVIMPSETSHWIDIRSYPAGVYYVRIGNKAVRFIKQ
jgi:photosystem II stability/assembly factor-like uncharacterized protein